VSQSADLVFIYANYRLNVFGFLPGPALPPDHLNPGLRDQDAAIAWANTHAAHFGGDPARVAVWGQSAGGGSVAAQVLAQAGGGGGSNGPKGKFTRALASSPFWPKTYAPDSPEARWVYDTVANRTGCGGAADSLACLKAAPVQALRDAAAFVAASHKYTTSSYTWAPVVDGAFLAKRLSEVAPGELAAKAWRAFGMYNTHEGEDFIPPGLKSSGGEGGFNSSEASFAAWLRGFLPGFGEADLKGVEELYPPSGSTETLARYTGSYTRAGLLYRDVVLACPAYWMAEAAGDGGYLGEYSMSPSKHASDTSWVSGVSCPFCWERSGCLHFCIVFSGTPSSRCRRQTRCIIKASPELLRPSLQRAIRMPRNSQMQACQGYHRSKRAKSSTLMTRASRALTWFN
jgi:carboxylesterase type B